MNILEDKSLALSAERVKCETSQEFEALGEDELVASTVPSKYRGTVTDKEDMRTLGKTQVLRVGDEVYRMP